MTATPMPELGHEQPDEEISLPFNLYFGALNHPHWSTYDHNDRDARRRAEEERSKVREERVAKLPRLMDHLHYVKIAAGALAAFDRNGQGPDAAENLRTATRRFQTEVEQLDAAIAADAELWRENGRKAMEDLEQAPAKLSPQSHDRPRGGGPVTNIEIAMQPGTAPTPGDLARELARRGALRTVR